MTDAAEEYPRLLDDVARHAAAIMAERGIDRDLAAELGQELAEFLRAEWGGQQVYIPRGTHFELSARDVEIWESWNGDNVLELCRQYNISKQRLYQIIAAMKARETRKRQGRLFGDE